MLELRELGHMAKDCWLKQAGGKGNKGAWGSKGEGKGENKGKGQGLVNVGKGGPPRDRCFNCGEDHTGRETALNAKEKARERAFTESTKVLSVLTCS